MKNRVEEIVAQVKSRAWRWDRNRCDRLIIGGLRQSTVRQLDKPLTSAGFYIINCGVTGQGLMWIEILPECKVSK